MIRVMKVPKMPETYRSNESLNPSSSTTALRVGIVGFGKLAHDYYLPAFRKLKDVQIVAVADPLPGCREIAKAKILNVRTYSSYKDLLLHESPDGILVASPPSTHLQIWNDLSGHGIPIFMEKPFVLFGELGIVTSTPAARSLLMVDFNRRLWPTYRRLGELVRSGEIGDIEHADFTLRVDVRPWTSVTKHRLSPSEGGPLYDLGSQVLDLVHYVFEKEPISIQAQSCSDSPEVDHVKLAVSLAEKLTVQCDLAYGRRNFESIHVYGSEGHSWIHNPNMAIHTFKKDHSASKFPAVVQDYLLLGYRAWQRERAMMRHTIGQSLLSFITAIRRRQPFSLGFEHAIQNNLWLEAASQSLGCGRPVSVHEIKGQLAWLT